MILTTSLAGLIGLIFPLYIILTYQRLNANISKNEKYRLIDYKQTIIIFWSLTFLVLINYLAYHQPSLNFSPKLSILNIGLTILILAFSLFQYWTATKLSQGSVAPVRQKLKDVYHYLPKNKTELNWFIFLSLSAGICEEIIFRLFLFEYIKENAGLSFAFILTNLIFAVTHIGSGKNNLISSFILGLLFSAIYYFTGNIWIAVILHVAIDFNAGILGYRVNELLKNENLSSINS